MIAHFPEIPPDDDTPALMEHTVAGLIVHVAWYLDGKRHRVAGPALIRHGRATRVRIVEEWWRHGRLYCPVDPAVVERDAATGEITYEEWHDGRHGGDAEILPLRRNRR